jgi:hypothetical protein
MLERSMRRTMPGFAEGAVNYFHVRFTPESGHPKADMIVEATYHRPMFAHLKSAADLRPSALKPGLSECPGLPAS